MRVSNAKVHTSEFKCTKKHLKNACLSEPENEITEKHTGPAELVGQFPPILAKIINKTLFTKITYISLSFVETLDQSSKGFFMFGENLKLRWRTGQKPTLNFNLTHCVFPPHNF